jgi:hypothetical protein
MSKEIASDYPRSQGVAFSPIHGFASAILKAIFMYYSRPLPTTPGGRGFIEQN